jgi:predicted nucleic acid-binding protein
VVARALIDTSALLALAGRGDQHAAQARDIAGRFLAGGGRFTGTALVLAELHTLLLYRSGPARARAALSAVLADPAYVWLDVSVALQRSAIGAWLERFHDQPFSLVDAVSFEVMRRERLTHAFAFDRHFETAGFELLA